jgi:flagellar biosynthesis/type III secretory pathway M-ring protein FliF/YscJ
MGALQKLISQIMERLRDTTLSQRVALFLGGALVAISLIWLVQWAATPEMVPLLDQDLSAEDLVLVQSGLDALGRDYDDRGQPGNGAGEHEQGGPAGAASIAGEAAGEHERHICQTG